MKKSNIVFNIFGVLKKWLCDLFYKLCELNESFEKNASPICPKCGKVKRPMQQTFDIGDDCDQTTFYFPCECETKHQ